ncbi:Conserved hypothetical protein (plasmid) [Clostridium acetobutylicum EA 2018]|uniref:Uncharacterized protein n=1 Tax=Clostridium acetobutylicum (strain ATCC 824 / DSM 792 / JCM 1419 / IAM 19013 / LMG 5710 / NBRC 13948 / NRRL B-527 / VKM B-1787 / 2291 / W) TaxID=272562 RepID=Q97TT9_CLOAB|nr:Hypothetical protein CA_P0007 [Clostridium acetobutylicum ATCC 824]ADZ22790.1 Conserved hypothetical protein [Clostridium acetobutylicum EA 2018]AEI34750.1 hypothetical protein SMB_P007 [Clostridium acetobutylicum DSM 1731]AWV82297.1 hypothetical protein DK921_19585 [Clostridium acetobutylicum]PSM04334.1 hypothetical protein C7T89_18180 [Clostridium sp. NJ4]
MTETGYNRYTEIIKPIILREYTNYKSR